MSFRGLVFQKIIFISKFDNFIKFKNLTAFQNLNLKFSIKILEFVKLSNFKIFKLHKILNSIKFSSKSEMNLKNPIIILQNNLHPFFIGYFPNIRCNQHFKNCCMIRLLPLREVIKNSRDFLFQKIIF